MFFQSSMRLFLPLLLCIVCRPGLAAPWPGEIQAAPVDAVPSIQEMRSRLEMLEKQVAAGKAPRDAQNLALLRFKLEQARLWLERLEDKYSYYSYGADRGLATALDSADSINRATGDFAAQTRSPLHQRAYIAPADNSAQPYWVFLPDGYTPRRKYPLVVFLHGYDPDISKIEPWLPDESIWKLATGRGFIFAVPYGRRNSDFVGIGEDDTLAVTDAVQRLYSVDAARTFLLGPSMGGYGVYAVGLHQPHRWAGLAPMCARSDFYLWFKLDRATTAPWKRLLYDADDPRHLAANAFQLPIFLQQGALDHIVNVEHSRRMTADLRALNYPIRYREIPDAGHYIYWENSTYEIALDWMRRVPVRPAPRRIAYTTGDLKNHRAYWLKIDALQDYSRTAHIEVEIKAGNRIEATTANVAGFTLTPPARYLDRERPVTLVVNGLAQKHTVSPLRWPVPNASAPNTSTTAPAPFPGLKSPLRCGPIKNCYRDPFLLVYGTLGKGDGPNPDEVSARRYASEWRRYADGAPPIKADREVSEDDRKRYNLILFGTRSSNAVLASITDKLPLELMADGYRLGSEKFAATDIGLQFCYPSPFDARRMIVVQSGLYWGEALPINHKLDLLPDYIVYSSQRNITDDTNHDLAAGFFDGNWQIAQPAQTP
ncbi:MAG TPA: prolyl oligopeptidase family serine peptidase [Abditibacteriaceae bacterium]|nr:prolyl oligopeptidase family serine peptidase [Abditibacteriaceae bacterium]